ncbi:DNA alkylation repair protein [Malaciobacter molluscorum LMG 25693]|uniref:3-methyladenine DNA glycosylase n=1 Tax=Malaciobacter molluscorum LMG 25693 TaxID=870501 RepID=A0A2G1DII8_9BACT|nr:DNA alkylation repair protein [Malaciobacter molluscorum]AXX91903.1 3-methyladenine DNA glycosylase [Malaciobacter molluscorum LMG 25693]PHO18305.1 DNA alkylation repair protein [Malaciobacter molluscorum LMG 25693]
MAEQLKNVYTKEYIRNLAYKIKENYQKFDSDSFINSIFNSTWETLELKMRMRHIAVTLNTFLPLSYKEQLEILKPISKYFSGFEAMFFQDFVEVYGLDDFQNSMEALEVFTIDSSSEFAIRAFILKYEDKTMSQMRKWAKSSNEHIRRLASEGSRPRLPWAVALPKFKKDPTKVFEIIKLLKNDKSKYVQKSVANNLNDISKDNPKLVIEFVKNNLGISVQLDWICKHASRTLLKKGNKEILELFSFGKTNHINISNFLYDKIVNIDDYLNFSFELNSSEPIGNIRLEYVIYYLKSNNMHNKKIFMISQNEIKLKNKKFSKKQSFKNMTTRKHYLGKHYISIVINGKEMIKKEFILK